MSNILWIQPNQTLALTSIFLDDVSPEDHAKELQDRGDIPSDWTVAGYNVDWPQDGHPQESYRWVNNKIVVDQIALAEIQAQKAEPTKEELLAKLTELQNQIAAL